MKNNFFSDYQLAPQWGLTDNSTPVQELTVGVRGGEAVKVSWKNTRKS